MKLLLTKIKRIKNVVCFQCCAIYGYSVVPVVTFILLFNLLQIYEREDLDLWYKSTVKCCWNRLFPKNWKCWKKAGQNCSGVREDAMWKNWLQIKLKYLQCDISKACSVIFSWVVLYVLLYVTKKPIKFENTLDKDSFRNKPNFLHSPK